MARPARIAMKKMVTCLKTGCGNPAQFNRLPVNLICLLWVDSYLSDSRSLFLLGSLLAGSNGRVAIRVRQVYFDRD